MFLKFYRFFACVAAIFKRIICSILHYKNNRFILCQFRRRNLHEQKNIKTLKTYMICRWNTKVYLNIPFVQILDNGRKRPLSSVSAYTAVRKRIFLIEKSTNGKKVDHTKQWFCNIVKTPKINVLLVQRKTNRFDCSTFTIAYLWKGKQSSMLNWVPWKWEPTSYVVYWRKQ